VGKVNVALTENVKIHLVYALIASLIRAVQMAVVSIINVYQSGATSVLKRTNVLQTRTATVVAVRTTNAKSRLRIVLTNAIVPLIVIHQIAVAVWMDLVVLALKVNLFLHIEPILYYEN
jgi:hypothetical protein